MSCCNLKRGFFFFLEGCYLKLEKQFFFECVSLGFRVICEYMFGNAVLFPFLFTQFLFGCYCDFYFLRPQCPSLNPMPNAQVCVYLMVHITKPDMKYKFFKQLSIFMVTHWKSNVEIWQSFTIFSPHFWLLKPSKIFSFLNFWIFHFTFQRNFSGKNNGIKGLSGRICHRGPNP